jgi:hypothetical protein
LPNIRWQRAGGGWQAAAFRALMVLHSRKFPVQQQHYAVACGSLADDNEAVRTVALNMVTVVSAAHPDQMVASQNADMVPRRMIDDAFATVCNSLTDLSVAVRVHAAQLLGKMRGVSEDFLLQTFDKKVMSHLRKKKTEHELIKDKARAATHLSTPPPHLRISTSHICASSHPTSAHLHIPHLRISTSHICASRRMLILPLRA